MNSSSSQAATWSSSAGSHEAASVSSPASWTDRISFFCRWRLTIRRRTLAACCVSLIGLAGLLFTQSKNVTGASWATCEASTSGLMRQPALPPAQMLTKRENLATISPRADWSPARHLSIRCLVEQDSATACLPVHSCACTRDESRIPRRLQPVNKRPSSGRSPCHAAPAALPARLVADARGGLRPAGGPREQLLSRFGVVSG